MTLGEFKAWKDGYLAARGKKLGDKDYAAILKKLDEVQPEPCGCWRCRQPWITYTSAGGTPNIYAAETGQVSTPEITWCAGPQQ